MKVVNQAQRRSRSRTKREGAFVEPLETRMLLSAASHIVHPGIITSQIGSGSADISGDTPAQIRKAYGIDQINLGDGATPDGTGQTIAIVDPYNDPSVLSDLNVFDKQFGISAPPSFKVVNQEGSSRLPRTDGGWAGEIATDVEWAHVVAPGASILLVEADSDNTSDLMAAEDYAIKQPGVSVISISWGGSEFASQTTYDSDFNTPSGHQGVTVLTAAGDDGASAGAQWPADAPNVVSVGGSVLSLADDSGSYGSETSWTDGSGGISKFEKEPAFQQVVQRSGFRSMPDVAINSDDIIGVALYDSVPYQGITGWQTTNGTSVGTPEWAGLVAIANQGRVLNGQATLDGAGQTLPLLYSLYSAPGTSGYATYTSYFNDITLPQNPDATTGLPTVGYDLTTGLGSPKSASIVTALVNSPSAEQLAADSHTLASLLTLTISKQPPDSVVSGTAGKISLKLTNGSNTAFSGALTINLYTSTDVNLPADASPIATLTLAKAALRVHGTRSVVLPFTYPSLASKGDYYLIASASAAAGNSTSSVAASENTTTIAPPFVKLTPVFTGNSLVKIRPGKSAAAPVLIRNDGNVTGVGTFTVSIFESTNRTLDDADTLLATSVTKKLNLRSGKTITLRVPFAAPLGIDAGYYLIATIASTATSDTGTAVVGTR